MTTDILDLTLAKLMEVNAIGIFKVLNRRVITAEYILPGGDPGWPHQHRVLINIATNNEDDIEQWKQAAINRGFVRSEKFRHQMALVDLNTANDNQYYWLPEIEERLGELGRDARLE